MEKFLDMLWAFTCGILVAVILINILNVNLAHEARLIGLCNGKIYAAMHEDEFPYGCTWIERINYETGR